MTWMAIITIASHCVGLTLPGMIDEPGSLAGSSSSPRPHRGPEASHRMSLAIFISVTARPRSAAWARTIGSSEPRAANLFGAVTNGTSSARRASIATSAPKPFGALSPVPTAVPPTARSKQALARVLDIGQTRLELGGVARPLLADRQRHRVLEVGAADLDDRSSIRRTSPRSRRAARSRCGISASSIAVTAAMCIAVGKVSLLHWPMLTWSFGSDRLLGCPARRRAAGWRGWTSTSLTFMLLCVPEPVCQT